MENKLVLNKANILDDISYTELSKVPALKALSSIIRFSAIVIEEIILLVFLSIYFIIGAAAVIMYMIFYEHLYKMIFDKGKRENPASPYYYKWKNHHLELNCED